MRKLFGKRIGSPVRSEVRRGTASRGKHDCVRSHMSARPFQRKFPVICKLLHLRAEYDVSIQPFKLPTKKIGHGGSLAAGGIYAPARVGQENSAQAFQKVYRILRAEFF